MRTIGNTTPKISNIEFSFLSNLLINNLEFNMSNKPKEKTLLFKLSEGKNTIENTSTKIKVELIIFAKEILFFTLLFTLYSIGSPFS